MNHYVMIQRNDRYWIVGPFHSEIDAGTWGAATYDLDSDPRWQTIQLDDPAAAPTVMHPGTATQYAMAGEPK